MEDKNKKVIKEVTLSDGTVIKMRNPKLRDIKAVNDIADSLLKESTLISNISGKTVEELDNMDFGDYTLLSNEINGFLFSIGAMEEKA